MAERRQAEDMSRAADRLVEAVDEFTRQVERTRPPEPLSEKEADRLGVEAVHETRSEWVGAGGYERGEITGEEAREWYERREERRRREGYKPI